MELNDLIEILPEHPCDVMQNGFGKKAFSESFYLYEIHNMHHNWYENNVWIFNSINEFVQFLPAIVFNDIAVNCEEGFEDEHVDYDYSEDYNFYKSLVSQKWDELKCKEFISEHSKFGGLELIEFGRVSDLLECTQQEYNKCKDSIYSLDELEELELSQGRYKIFHAFHSVSENRPSLNEKAFIQMIEDWDGN